MTAPGGCLPPIPWSLQRSGRFTMPQKLALMVLWGRADAEGRCYTSIAQLAGDIPCNTKTARTALHYLASEGLIRLSEQEGKASAVAVQPEAIMSYLDRQTPTRIGSGATPTRIGTPPKTGRGGLPKQGGVPLPKQGAKEIPYKNNPEEGPGASPSLPVFSKPPETTTRAAQQPTRPKKKNNKPTPEDVAVIFPELCETYADIWTADEVSIIVEDALNHDALSKRTDWQKYLKNWLRRDAATERAKGAYTNGTQAAPAGQRTGTGAGLSWDERHAHVRPPAEPDDLSRFD